MEGWKYKKFKIKDLIEQCKDYAKVTKEKITLEVVINAFKSNHQLPWSHISFLYDLL